MSICDRPLSACVDKFHHMIPPRDIDRADLAHPPGLRTQPPGFRQFISQNVTGPHLRAALRESQADRAAQAVRRPGHDHRFTRKLDIHFLPFLEERAHSDAPFSLRTNSKSRTGQRTCFQIRQIWLDVQVVTRAALEQFAHRIGASMAVDMLGQPIQQRLVIAAASASPNPGLLRCAASNN